MDHKKYLPSLTFTLFVGAFFLSGALIYGAMYLGQGKKPAILSVKDARPTDPALAILDTDHDGLPDWEEAVRGTNPTNADTDGDGSLDGEEVPLGRDPNKAAPNDSLITKENEKFIAQLLEIASSTNVTTDISQTLLVQYAGALNKGSSGDMQTQEALVKEALARSKVPLKGRVYTQADLIIVSETKESVRAFANQSIEAIGRHPNASFVNSVIIFGEAVDNGNKQAVRAFPVLGDEYHRMVEDLLRIPVPASYAGLYLQVINAFEKCSGAFDDIAQVEKDPVRALSGFANYVQMMLLSVDVLKGIAQKIIGSGILFNASEAGNAWKAILAP